MFCNRVCDRPTAGPSVRLGQIELVLGRFRQHGLNEVLLYQERIGSSSARGFVLNGFDAASLLERMITAKVVINELIVEGCPLVPLQPGAVVVVHQDAAQLEALFLAVVLAGQGSRIQYSQRWLSLEFEKNRLLHRQLWTVATDEELRQFLDEWIFTARS